MLVVLLLFLMNSTQSEMVSPPVRRARARCSCRLRQCSRIRRCRNLHANSLLLLLLLTRSDCDAEDGAYAQELSVRRATVLLFLSSFFLPVFLYIFRLATGGWEGVLNYLRKLPGWSNGTHHIVADNFVDGHWGDQYCSHMNPMCTKHVRQEQQLSLSLFCFVHFQSSND